MSSRQIDEKVVSMKFDNKQFEANIQTSIRSLENLKKSLNFNGVEKGFDSISQAAGRVDIGAVGSGVDAVKMKFSALQVVAATALANITNQAINTGRKIANAIEQPLVQGGINRALNIEQAKFQLKGLEIAWKDIADDIEYAVRGTAYGLDAAAKAASQLSASNVKVGDDMKTALRGISGVAAMTNSSYEEISRIFTQVAGQGRLMGDQLMQLSSRGMNAAATLANALGKTEAEIREMVSDGKIDFNTFAKAMDDAFGEHAKDANQTFTGALSNMKAALARIGADVAAPGLNNLRDIFNAIRVKIDAAHKALGPFINRINEFQNKVTKSLVKFIDGIDIRDLSNPWRKFTTYIHEAGVTTKEFQKALRDTLTAHNVSLDNLIKSEGSLANAMKKIPIEWVTEAFGRLTGKQNEVNQATDKLNDKLEYCQNLFDKMWAGDFGEGAENRIKAMGEAGKDYAAIQALVNKHTSGTKLTLDDLADTVVNLSDKEVENLGYTKEEVESIRKLQKEAKDSGSTLHMLIENLSYEKKPTFFNGMMNIFKGLGKIIKAIAIAWNRVFGKNKMAKDLDGIGKAMYAVTEKFNFSDKAVDQLIRTFEGLFSLLDLFRRVILFPVNLACDALRFVLEQLDMSILDVTAAVGDAITNFRDWALTNNIVVDGLRFIFDVVQKVYTAIRDFIVQFLELPQVQVHLTELKNAFVNFGSALYDNFSNADIIIGDFIDRCKELDGLSLSNIKTVIADFVENVLGKLFDTGEALTALKDSFGNLFSDAFSSLSFEFPWLEDITDFIKGIGETLSDNKLGIAGGILGILGGVATISVVKKFGKLLNVLIDPLEAFISVMDSLSTALDAWAKKMKAEAFLKIAEGLLVIAAAVWIIAKIKLPDLAKAVIAIGVLTAIMVGAVWLLTKLSDSPLEFASIGAALMGIAGAFALIAITVKIISKMELWQIGLGIGLIFGYYLLIRALAKLSDEMKTRGDSLIGVGKMMKDLGVALLLMAVSLRIIGKMELGQVIKAVGAVAVIMVLIGKMIATVENMGANASQFAMFIKSIGSAFLLMAISFKIIGSMPVEKWLMAVATLAGVMVGIVYMIKTMGDQGANAAQFAMVMKSLGTSFLLISVAFKILGSLSLPQLGIALLALAGFGAIVIGMVALMELMNKKMPGGMNGLSRLSKLMNAIALCILTMSLSIALLAIVPGDHLAEAAMAVAAIALVVGVLVGYLTNLANTGNPNGIKQAAKLLIAIGVVIGIISIALAGLSFIEWNKLIAPVIAISAVIGVIIGLVAVLSKLQQTTINTKAVVTLMGGIALVVGILGGVLYLIGQNDFANTTFAAAAMAACLIAIVAAFRVIADIDFDGKSIVKNLIPMVVAMGIIGLLIGFIAQNEWESITAAGAAIAGGIIALAYAIKIIAKATANIPVDAGAGLLSLAGGIVAFGVGLIAVGAGIVAIVYGIGMAIDLLVELPLKIKQFIENVKSLLGINSPSKVFMEIGKFIVLGLIKGIGSLIGMAFDALINAVKNLPETILKIAKGLFNVGKQIVKFIIDGAKEILPKLPKLLLEGIKALPGLLLGAGTILVDVGKKLIGGLVNGIKSMAGAAWDAAKSIVKGAKDKFDGFVDDIKSIGRDTTTGFSRGMLENLKEAGEAAGANVDAVEKMLNKKDRFKKIGQDVMDAYNNGMKEKAEEAKKKLLEIMDGMHKKADEKAKKFKKVGEDSVDQLDEGVKTKAAEAQKSMRDIMNKMHQDAESKSKEMYSVGGHMMTGLSNGMRDNSGKVEATATGMLGNLMAKMKAKLGIHSPSKVTAEMGRYLDLGMVNGLTEYSNRVYEASEYVGEKSIDGISAAMARVNDLIDSDIETRPVIRPVVDLDDAVNSINQMDSLLNSNRRFDVIGNTGAISNYMNARQNGNADIISAIDDLGNNLSGKSGDVYNINGITYDDGSNVSNAVGDLIRAARIERRI